MKKIKDCGCQKDVFACRAHAHPAHTPTPWRVETDMDDDHSYLIITSEGTRTIANLDDSDEVDEANAAFIVTAVNVHEELLAIARCVADSFKKDEIPENVYEVIDKAEGR